MLNKLQIIIIIMTFLSLASCKKDEDNTLLEPSYIKFTGDIGTNDNSTLISYDQNLIICGNSGANISVLKISKSGNQIWRKDFFAGKGSSAYGIAQTSNQELFICGKTDQKNSDEKNDILLVKTNSEGDTIWTKVYGGIESDYSACIITTSDGNLLIAGKTESFGAGTFGDIYLLKLNTNGDILWTRSYPDQDQEVPFNIIETQNGEFLITGTNEDNSQYRELYLLKVSANGQQLWNRKIGPPTWKWGYSTLELTDGNLLVCGKHTVGGYNQILVVKTDNIGNVIWENEYGAVNLSEEGNSIKQNIDGTYTITGSCFDVSTGKTDILLLKIDKSGNQLWLKKFGSTSGEGVNLIKDTNDDNIITGNYNGSMFMTKTDSNGDYK